MSSSDEETHSDIENLAAGLIMNLVPQKSREKYCLAFENYEKCMEKKLRS